MSGFVYILFGFYKNGITLYNKGYVDLLGMFKPLLFIIVGAILGIIVNIIYDKLILKNNNKLIDTIFSSFHLVYVILIACISSINTNIFLFSIVTFIILFISKFFKDNRVNVVALASLIIFFIMNIFHEFSFLNAYESSNNFNMNAIDYLFGKGSGGIFTTNILLLAISYIIWNKLDTETKSERESKVFKVTETIIKFSAAIQFINCLIYIYSKQKMY